MKIETFRRRIELTYRLCAIRVSSAFHTISEDAVCIIIAGLLPIIILAEKSKKT